jgi:glycerophosphoryl diester phosphodiesterase
MGTSSAAVAERASRQQSALARPTLAGPAWRDFRRAWPGLVAFEIAFKLLDAWLLVPAIAWLLSAALAQSGRVAVSNTDILNFLLSPAGMAYAAAFGTVVLALLLLEQAGIMAIAALSGEVDRPPLRRLLPAALGQIGRAVQLSAIKLAALALTLAPFVLLGALAYALLLTQHDIYFYLKDRPPRFWLAATIGGMLALAAVAVGAWLYVQWSLALPILLFEKQGASTALRASRDRVRGAAWRVGGILLGWQLGVLALGTLLGAGFRLIAAWALAAAGERPTVVILLLVAQATLLAAVSFVAAVGQALLTRRIYLARSALPEAGASQDDQGLAAGKSSPRWAAGLAAVALASVAVPPLVLWASLPNRLGAESVVQVTAHRGHARAAPENTLSAMRKAIESGADYVEMDVQQTADGVVVLLHDRDLKRVAGLSRRLDEMSFDEVRRLDVGAWFDPVFAGERVPTLAEVIDLCRGRTRLNIELKFFGPDRRLAEAVAGIVSEKGIESDCLITSLEYDGLVETKRHHPQLRTGLTVAHALGDVSRLQVDALSVRAEFLSDELLSAARRLGREVHVWTINDARQMTWQIKRGVDNLITSDPDLARAVRNEWASLTGPQRLLLSARLLLGLQP